MLKTLTLGAAAIASTMVAMPAAAEAQSGYYGYRYPPRANPYGYRYQQRAYPYGYQYQRAPNGYYARNGGYYGRNGNYYGRNGYNNGHCRDSGTTGTIVGAIAGGLLGHEVVGRYGDKTMGAIIGGAAGAVAGRAIDRNC